MSIKKQIHQLEHSIESLKSNELDFEEQITIYQKSLDQISALHQTIDNLKASILSTETSKASIDEL